MIWELRRLSVLPLALIVLLPSGCSFEKQVTERSAAVFRGSIINIDSGAVISTFCAVPPAEPASGSKQSVRNAEAIHVKAAAGTHLREDIQWEARDDRIEGPAPPQRDQAFWCAGGGEARTNAPILIGWACKTARDPDPAAIVEEVRPLGEVSGGYAQGYSLTLRVVHPGIVWTVYEPGCSQSQYQRVVDLELGELTIDPP